MNRDREAERSASPFRGLSGAHPHDHPCLCFCTVGPVFPWNLTSTLGPGGSPPNDAQLRTPLRCWGVKAGHAQKKMLFAV